MSFKTEPMGAHPTRLCPRQTLDRFIFVALGVKTFKPLLVCTTGGRYLRDSASRPPLGYATAVSTHYCTPSLPSFLSDVSKFKLRKEYVCAEGGPYTSGGMDLKSYGDEYRHPLPCGFWGKASKNRCSSTPTRPG